jgi:capsid protein
MTTLTDADRELAGKFTYSGAWDDIERSIEKQRKTDPHGASIREQEMLAGQIARETEKCRDICDRIKALDDLHFSERVAAQIAAVLSARIDSGNFSHTNAGMTAMEQLDGAHDALTKGKA